MDELLLWAEDLQCHREPSLYYLGDEEGADGPHLICDWNGSPTDFSELDIDILRYIREHELIDKADRTGPAEESEQTVFSEHEYLDYPNPTTEVAKTIQKSNSYFLLGNDDRALFDFISVPPITSGLLKRIVRSVQASKVADTTKQPAIPAAVGTTMQAAAATTATAPTPPAKRPVQVKNHQVNNCTASTNGTKSASSNKTGTSTTSGASSKPVPKPARVDTDRLATAVRRTYLIQPINSKATPPKQQRAQTPQQPQQAQQRAVQQSQQPQQPQQPHSSQQPQQSQQQRAPVEPRQQFRTKEGEADLPIVID